MSSVVSPSSARTPVGSYTAPDATAVPSPARATPSVGRIASIDIIRGAVMVLMAIDHVRVFSGIPAGGPTPGLFFTRWVTHFCAPAFIFLAGTAAYLHGRKLPDRNALARFLLTRGTWLVILELTVLRFGWTFNVDYANYMLAGVIWVIGWCMILMAALIYLPVVAIGTIGVAIIALHNLTDPFAFQLDQAFRSGRFAWLWQVLYRGGTIPLGGEDGSRLAVLYSIVPWIGVMAAGFAFGPLMTMPAERRRRLCFAIGGGAIAAFLVLRGFNLYGDPRPWGDAARQAASQRAAAQRAAAQRPTPGQQTALPRPASRPAGAGQPGGGPQPPSASPTARSDQPSAATTAGGTPNAGPAGPPAGTPQSTAASRRPQQPPRVPAYLQFLGTAKYPASLLFLLMTLGPTILLIPLLERARGPVANVLTIFGRVPFFYYVLHIPLIHLIFVGLSLARYGEVIPWMTANHPMFMPPPPDGYTYSLTVLYLITVLAVAILYVPCRWFAGLKARRRDWWLGYV